MYSLLINNRLTWRSCFAKYFRKGKQFQMDKQLKTEERRASRSPLPEVYVLSQIPNLYSTLLKIARSDIHFNPIPLPDKFSRDLQLSRNQLQEIEDAEIVICDNLLLAKIIPQLPNLKWAHCTWAGVDPIMNAVKSFEQMPNFALTRHGGFAFGSLMAEYVICQILNWERNMRKIWEDQKLKIWGHENRFEGYRSISGLVITILGVGNISKAVATFLKQFGATVQGFSRTPKTCLDYKDFQIISQSLQDVLSNCDYVVNTLPHTPSTINLLTDDVLQLCHNKPVFINVGRGSIITELALLKAIELEWISGAVLDVFEKEPLSQSSHLWESPQIMITPHVSAISKEIHIAEEFLKNYERFISGSNLLYKVDWSSGY